MMLTYDFLSGSSSQSLQQYNIMLYDILYYYYYYGTNWCNHTNMEHWCIISINYLLIIVGTRSFSGVFLELLFYKPFLTPGVVPGFLHYRTTSNFQLYFKKFYELIL